MNSEDSLRIHAILVCGKILKKLRKPACLSNKHETQFSTWRTSTPNANEEPQTLRSVYGLRTR